MISPGVASFTVTLPTMFLLVDWATITATSGQLLVCYCINGVFFHCQTIAAYYLMDYISPVTHSVANTGKVRLKILPTGSMDKIYGQNLSGHKYGPEL